MEPEIGAADLKAQGNAAYGRGEVEEALRLWNLAIRAHVQVVATYSIAVGCQELSDGKACSEESSQLERAIYLNLAQGYLKLQDGERALRACKAPCWAFASSA